MEWQSESNIISFGKSGASEGFGTYERMSVKLREVARYSVGQIICSEVKFCIYYYWALGCVFCFTRHKTGALIGCFAQNYV